MLSQFDIHEYTIRVRTTYEDSSIWLAEVCCNAAFRLNGPQVLEGAQFQTREEALQWCLRTLEGRFKTGLAQLESIRAQERALGGEK